MAEIKNGDLLWQPTAEVIASANLTRYMDWLAAEHDLHFADYNALWHWSVTEIGPFWQSIWHYFDVLATRPYEFVLSSREMPGARWFGGAELNYAQNIFAKMTPARPMMLFQSEERPLQTLSWAEVYRQTNLIAQALRRLGVGKGDRVVAYLPNIPQAVIALLATASLGAIWSSCAPDFGAQSVLDRFAQIEPKILIAVDGYRYGGKPFDRLPVVRQLQAGLPTLEKTVLVPYLQEDISTAAGMLLWPDLLAAEDAGNEFAFAPLPFDHPLWVLYSSGTTGLPKPIVHGHGGVVLEHVKATAFHNDLGPDDRFFWYSSTGWMMWNYLLGSLLCGATIILYDGSAAYPNLSVLWELAEKSGATYFGTSAAFISACMKAGIRPNKQYNLQRLRGVGSTGSPLPLAGFDWVYRHVKKELALESLSGGTDLCTAFIGGSRILPVYAGELQAISLGAKAEAFNQAGVAVTGRVGELVLTEPMPTMPLYFWNDPDFHKYQESYFEMYPGIWRHGDWIEINGRGGCVIYGRSDATINRQGIRMGTSEIYQVVESFPELLDSLIIDLELLERESFLPLFVVLRPGLTLDEDLRRRIKQKLREDISPRHVPDEIVQIAEIPYTLSGKKMEIPIRKILLGLDMQGVVNPGAMRNPESLKYFQKYAQMLGKLHPLS